MNKHTSVFLDLKNRALVLTYLDIIVEETPIIPYSINRRYVFGSTSASVEIFGEFTYRRMRDRKIIFSFNNLYNHEIKLFWKMY